jgi:hypothetical protein
MRMLKNCAATGKCGVSNNARVRAAHWATTEAAFAVRRSWSCMGHGHWPDLAESRSRYVDLSIYGMTGMRRFLEWEFKCGYRLSTSSIAIYGRHKLDSAKLPTFYSSQATDYPLCMWLRCPQSARMPLNPVALARNKRHWPQSGNLSLHVTVA